MPARRVALVPAAGGGSRFGGALPKQYADLGGRPLLERTIDALVGALDLDVVFVALAPDDELFAERTRQRRNVEPLFCGGATRADTVANALTAACRTLRRRRLASGARCGAAVRTRRRLAAARRRARRRSGRRPAGHSGGRYAEARGSRDPGPRAAHRGPRRTMAGADAADVPLRRAPRGVRPAGCARAPPTKRRRSKRSPRRVPARRRGWSRAAR